MVEDLIEKFEATTQRQRLIAAGVLLVLMVLVGVGLNTITSGFLTGGNKPAPGAKAKAKPAASTSAKSAGGDARDSIVGIENASFAYLSPGADKNWAIDEGSKAYEDSKGVVKYTVKLKNSGTSITISEQIMPADLVPKGSEAFLKFIAASKPTRSNDLSEGTLYFLPALQNGVPASGSDTVIYATNEVLMFGRAERVVGYEGWMALMSAMRPVGR